uniref:Somatomedin B and thrombospondin type 1 domain containing n=1 Tax=Sinocyclocheilus grahami TaxID=75366 RepID=A0A672LLB0_SINGR
MGSAVLVVAALFGMYQFAEGGCSGGRCCQGTDFTCVTTDWRIDRVYGTCYCDERCLKTKDCCFDYPTECPGMWYSNIWADYWVELNCVGLIPGAAFITTMEYSKGRTHDFFCMEFKMESLTPQCMVENRPYTRWMQYLREGYSVCVACQPLAMNNHSRSCQGDVPEAYGDELLHWQAAGSPRCRGTWRKVQRLQHCSCPQVHSFIFI